MTDIANRQPDNPNFLQGVHFKFTLARAPALTYMCQTTELPSIDLDITSQSGPFVTMWRPGHKIYYADLSLTFMVDENMQNYLEIYNWMNNLGFPDDMTSGYPALARTPNIGKGDGVWSDGSLIMLDSKQQPKFNVRFVNMFPYQLSSMTFDTTATDMQYQACTVMFKYHRYYIEAL